MSNREGLPEYPDRGRGGADARSWVNVNVFLRWAEIDLRRNEFTNDDEVDGELLDEDNLTRVMDLAHQSGLRIDREFLFHRLKATALSNAYHPVKDYFAKLKWDGKERLDAWLTTYMGAPSSDYTRAVGSITLIAAVRRIRRPGTKFDTLLVLEGDQGIGKSSALAALAIKREWFTDCVSLKDDTKLIIEQTAGKMIVEIPELSGMRRAEVEHVKTNLSRTHDRSRLAYARAVTEIARQFIMIGTTNVDDDGKAGYLKDHTGNRRFWPVKAHKINLDALTKDRKQLWAEAVKREADGASLVLPKSLWEVAERKQNARMEHNSMHEALRSELGNKQGRILIEDIWQFIGKKPGARTTDDERKLGEAMRKLGFDRRQFRHEGSVKYHYARGDAYRRIGITAGNRLK